jgi:tRNA (cytosine38-C5)-methyltransferase
MTIRVLELFSGMGGTHAALKASGVDLSVVCAADINTVANAVYAHSFPETPCISKNIECFPADKPLCDFDLLTMSPPCQPFTRNGTRLDLGDARTKVSWNLKFQNARSSFS